MLLAALMLRLPYTLRLLGDNLSGISLVVAHDIGHRDSYAQEPISELMAKGVRESELEKQRHLSAEGIFSLHDQYEGCAMESISSASQPPSVPGAKYT